MLSRKIECIKVEISISSNLLNFWKPSIKYIICLFEKLSVSLFFCSLYLPSNTDAFKSDNVFLSKIKITLSSSSVIATSPRKRVAVVISFSGKLEISFCSLESMIILNSIYVVEVIKYRGIFLSPFTDITKRISKYRDGHFPSNMV